MLYSNQVFLESYIFIKNAKNIITVPTYNNTI